MSKRNKIPKRREIISQLNNADKAKHPRLQRLMVTLVLVLVAAQVVLVNSLVAGGREIKRLEAERKYLKGEIVTLENKVAQAGSLTTIRKRARDLGMVLGKVEFLSAPSVASAATVQDKLTP